MMAAIVIIMTIIKHFLVLVILKLLQFILLFINGRADIINAINKYIKGHKERSQLYMLILIVTTHIIDTKAYSAVKTTPRLNDLCFLYV